MLLSAKFVVFGGAGITRLKQTTDAHAPLLYSSVIIRFPIAYSDGDTAGMADKGFAVLPILYS